MRDKFPQATKDYTDDQIVYAWSEHSSTMSAGWLITDSEDEESMTHILKSFISAPKEIIISGFKYRRVDNE